MNCASMLQQANHILGPQLGCASEHARHRVEEHGHSSGDPHAMITAQLYLPWLMFHAMLMIPLNSAK
jgi:hypothetical protein